VHDVILFEDIGNCQTKLTFIGNETVSERNEEVNWRVRSRYSINLLQLLPDAHVPPYGTWVLGSSGVSSCSRPQNERPGACARPVNLKLVAGVRFELTTFGL
jgi:hypothetical protein